jgi:hypothetical protein
MRSVGRRWPGGDESQQHNRLGQQGCEKDSGRQPGPPGEGDGRHHGGGGNNSFDCNNSNGCQGSGICISAECNSFVCSVALFC